MREAAGRTLAVDPGTVRIGLALSDPLGISVRPLAPLQSSGRRQDIQALARIAREEEVVKILVGLPLLLSGEDGHGAVASRRLAARLRDRLPDVSVELWDERLTTVEAQRVLSAAGVKAGRRRERVDGLAASVILQDYLDARSGGGEPPA